MNHLKITVNDLQQPVGDSSAVSQNNFRIFMNMGAESFVQKAAPPSIIPAAYAMRCEDNHVGLKDKITGFSITCNKNILGIEAGQPIDFDKMNVYKIGFYDDFRNQRKTITQWLEILNNGGYQLAFAWYIEFNQPIISEDFLTFTVKIKQESGSEFHAETYAVKIN